MDIEFKADRGPYEAISAPGARPPFALATIVEVSGSAPQTPGASALFGPAGLLRGTVGGGAVEAAAGRAARDALADGRPRLVRLDLSRGLADEGGGVCGGRILMLVDPPTAGAETVFRSLVRDLRARRRGVLAVRIEEVRGRAARVTRRWLRDGRAERGFAGLPARILEAEARAALAAAAPRLAEAGRGRLYLEPHLPRLRLLVAGAGHVGRAVSLLGGFLGFEVSIVDDRPEFADPAKLPWADRVMAADMARAVRNFRAGPDTFIVIVTRGHRRDADVLRACIRGRAGYIGLIGSARKIGLMGEEFVRRRWATASQWGRVHAPIGLPIGSRTVEEIAVSIAAQLVQARRGRAAGAGP